MLKAAIKTPTWRHLRTTVLGAVQKCPRQPVGLYRCLLTAPVPAAHEFGALKFAITADAVQLGRKKGPLALYDKLVESGELQADSEQRRVMEILNAVYHGAPTRQSKGLYLYGDVGCGKTMAMDLFFSSMQSAGLRVERKHFHDFLNEAHRTLHQLKQKEGLPDGSPVDRLAERLAARLDVLCFDEFAVTTIQDCVLMMPLFSTLFHHGVTIVTTSNRSPEDLYTDGLNRHLYLPAFLKVLRAHCKVHYLSSGVDYRTVHYENSPDAGVFCWPPDREFIDQWFKAVAGSRSSKGHLDISYGRSVNVPQLSSCKRIARFSFNDLCKGFFSADDYLYLARQVHTILLEDVPKLTVDDHNEARRFTTLIDSCYEQHVRLICSMAASPEELLGGLRELKDMNMATLGSDGAVGCGDGDTSPQSSGVMQAIRRIKEGIADRQKQQTAKGLANGHGNGELLTVGPTSPTLDMDSTAHVLSAELERVRSHGDNDVAVWRQGDDHGGTRMGGSPMSGLTPLPQVSKAWDDRRRISNFTWESADPTAEAKTIKGVFTAAVASLQESGFAVDRCISRLKEMQTDAFQQTHRVKHSLA